MQIPSSPPSLAVFTVYSWRVVFAYYRVLACNGGVELDSDASGYGADNALNGGNGQDAHHEARMRMHRRHVSGSRRSVRSSRYGRAHSDPGKRPLSGSLQI